MSWKCHGFGDVFIGSSAPPCCGVVLGTPTADKVTGVWSVPVTSVVCPAGSPAMTWTLIDEDGETIESGSVSEVDGSMTGGTLVAGTLVTGQSLTFDKRSGGFPVDWTFTLSGACGGDKVIDMPYCVFKQFDNTYVGDQWTDNGGQSELFINGVLIATALQTEGDVQSVAPNASARTFAIDPPVLEVEYNIEQLSAPNPSNCGDLPSLQWRWVDIDSSGVVDLPGTIPITANLILDQGATFAPAPPATNYTITRGLIHGITSATATSFVIPGDYTTTVSVGEQIGVFDVNGNSASSGYLTVSSVSFDGTNTTVSWNADGSVVPANIESFNLGQLNWQALFYLASGGIGAGDATINFTRPSRDVDGDKSDGITLEIYLTWCQELIKNGAGQVVDVNGDLVADFDFI